MFENIYIQDLFTPALGGIGTCIYCLIYQMSGERLQNRFTLVFRSEPFVFSYVLKASKFW